MQPAPSLPQRLLRLIDRSLDCKVNCFCISELFFLDTALRNLTVDEMLNFVAENFTQIEREGGPVLTLIWSRSSFDLPIGKIRINELAKRPSGFPFGLILEHSFVQIDNEKVIQKADPRMTSKVEIIPLSKAIEPYTRLKGFEITRHSPITNRQNP